MRDVATAAGVSTATVSNVINHPHLVAARTRKHVQHIVQELGFQPDPRAQALRGMAINASEPLRHRPESKVPEDQSNVSNPVENNTPPPSVDPGLDAESLQTGNHLRFQIGPEKLSGTVDAVMPDRSCFWIWSDGGMGRRLIEFSEASALRVSAAD
jgi:hypothetical protein